MRMALVVTTAVIAGCVPNFGDFLSLIGSSCCAALAFIIPCLIHLRLQPNLSRLDKACTIFIALFGVAAMVLGTHESATELLHHYHGHTHERHPSL